MKYELKSGIKELDELVEQFENGEIDFVRFTSSLWNKGYSAGYDDCEQKMKEWINT